MSKIIVIHGPMASGKSTISSKLLEMLPNYVLIDRAYLKDTMLRRVKAKDPDLAKKLSAKAMFLIARILLKQGYNVILQEIRMPVVKKRLGTKYKKTSFYLYCSLDEAKKRDLKRQSRFVRPHLVEKMHEKHAYADKGDIEINTQKNSIFKTVEIILKHIKKN